MLYFGYLIGYQKPSNISINAKNLPSIIIKLDIIVKNIAKNFTLGKII